LRASIISTRTKPLVCFPGYWFRWWIRGLAVGIILLIVACPQIRGEDAPLRPSLHSLFADPNLWSVRASRAANLVREGADLNERDANGFTPLARAAHFNDPSLILFLISQGVPVDQPNPEGETALSKLARTHYPGVLEPLLKLGADPDRSDNKGRTPVHHAVMGSQPEQLKILLKAGGEVNRPDNSGNTPLLWATHHSQGTCLEILLQNGADPNIANAGGETPLMRASEYWDNPLLIRLLLESEANPHHRDNEGLSALDRAAKSAGRLPVIELLTVAGATATYIDPGVPPDSCDEQGDSLLIRAIRAKKDGAVAFLLSHGANPDLATQDGTTPLILAINTAPTIIPLLLDHGAAVDLPGQDERTPLHFAAQKDTLGEITQQLLEKGANPNLLASGSISPLMAALYSNQWRAAFHLLEGGARTQERNIKGKEPFHYAAWSGNTEGLVLLREFGADPGNLDDLGRNPFHWVVTDHNWWTTQRFDCIDLLLDMGVDPNLRDKESNTPLDLVLSVISDRGPELAGYFTLRTNAWDKTVPKMFMPGPFPVMWKSNHLIRPEVARAALENHALEKVMHVASGTPLLHFVVRQQQPLLVAGLLRNGADPQQADSQGTTALHLAIRLRNQALVSLLLRYGASPNIPDKGGTSPLALADIQDDAAMVGLLEHPPTLRAGLKPGAPPEEASQAFLEIVKNGSWHLVDEVLSGTVRFNLDVRDAEGNTPLLLALQAKALEQAFSLLQAGASAAIVNVAQETPLHLAASTGCRYLVKAVLNAGGNVGASDAQGRTPLFHAVSAGAPGVIELLLTSGAAVNQPDKQERTALFLAIKDSWWNEPVIWLLARHGADVNHQDANGITPLIEAVTQKLLPIVRRLVALGADLSRKDNRGRSALDLGLKYGSQDLQEWLRSRAPAVATDSAPIKTP